MKTNPILFVILVAGLTACSGGSPTGPTPSPTPTPEPPVVVAPEPTPAPPVPVPEPAPVPVPPSVPAPVKAWTGATETAHWFGPAPFGGHFPIEWRYSDLWFGGITATIQIQDNRSIFARTADGASIQIVFAGGTYGSWTYNGLKGQASGTLEYK